MCEGKPSNLEQHQANVKEASMQARIEQANRKNAYLKKREEEKGPSKKWRIILPLWLLARLFSEMAEWDCPVTRRILRQLLPSYELDAGALTRAL